MSNKFGKKPAFRKPPAEAAFLEHFTPGLPITEDVRATLRALPNGAALTDAEIDALVAAGATWVPETRSIRYPPTFES